MDKEQSKDLLWPLRIIIVGIFFWVIKPRYLTILFLPADNFFNVFGLEIIGTILVLIGVFIIYRIYPFPFTMISTVYIVFLLLYNISELIFGRYNFFITLKLYSPFFISIMLVFVSKIIQDGLRHFGSTELSRKWSYFAIITFFGFSVPYYVFVSMSVLGFCRFDDFYNYKITSNSVLLFLPVLIAFAFFLIYFVYYLIVSYKYLVGIQKKKT